MIEKNKFLRLLQQVQEWSPEALEKRIEALEESIIHLDKEQEEQGTALREMLYHAQTEYDYLRTQLDTLEEKEIPEIKALLLHQQMSRVGEAMNATILQLTAKKREADRIHEMIEGIDHRITRKKQSIEYTLELLHTFRDQKKQCEEAIRIHELCTIHRYALPMTEREKDQFFVLVQRDPYFSEGSS